MANMTSVILAAMMVSTLVFVGCSSPPPEKTVTDDATPEEMELSDNLNDLEELDQVGGEDLTFEELEEMVEE